MKLFIKRFSLVIIGIFLSLIIIECGLRLTGLTVSFYKQHKNNKILQNKSKYTIMCLGESTTDGQYPKQLQQILNEKYPNKFSIIDCGISATKLEIILNLLDNNINKYKPDIAICMMGINNGLTDFLHFINIENNEYIKKSKNINFKFYKLFLLIKTHLKFLFKTNNVAYTEEPSQQVISAFTLRTEGKYKEAKLLLEKILKNNPNDEVAYSELIIILNDYYSSSEEEQLFLCNMAINAIDKGFKFRKEWYYNIIFNFYLSHQPSNELRKYIDKTANEDIIFSTIYLGIMGIAAIKQKDYSKAEKCFYIRNKLLAEYPYKETYDLYRLIIRKLIDKNIQVICMQYPVLSIEPLKKELKDFNNIVFISNEKNFKDMLMQKTFDDLFIDQFAGDFGHCTDLGNTLIAENVVNTLENILNLKEN